MAFAMKAGLRPAPLQRITEQNHRCCSNYGDTAMNAAFAVVLSSDPRVFLVGKRIMLFLPMRKRKGQTLR